MKRTFIVSVSFGLVVPFLLIGIRYVTSFTNKAVDVFESVFWPSNVFLIAGGGWGMVVVSVLVNVFYYAIMGTLVWLGINGHRWALIIFIGVVSIISYALLRGAFN